MSEINRRHPRGHAGRFTDKAHDEPDVSMMSENDGTARFTELLESAAKLQEAIPGTVVVGGTAAAFHAGHRVSYDHDHVIEDMSNRYESILEAVESLRGWSTDPNVSKPPMTIMGELDGHQAGLRNMRRSRPLEVEDHALPSGRILHVPTSDETLRVKAFLASQRRAVRDYLDVAAMSENVGLDHAAEVLSQLDDYYEAKSDRAPVRTAVERALANPQPKDSRTLDRLGVYKGLNPRWADWGRIEKQCKKLAVAMSRKGEGDAL